MAEPAQPDLGAAMSPTGIKQEPNILDGLDLELALQAATKRPFEALTNGDDPSKRVKTEPETLHDNEFENDHGAEESLEDGLALLVQNALSNVGDLVDQFNQDADMPHTTSDSMDIDSVPVPDDPLSPVAVSFLDDPQKYLRNASRNALGNLAMSIILVFSQPFDDSIKLIRDLDSQHAQSFRQLQTSFEQIKRIYSTGSILSSIEVDLQDDESRTILGLSNLAQFGLWLLGGSLQSYKEAHQHFHAIFPDQISHLGAEVVELYLSLKTQLAIESLLARPPDQQADHMLNEVFVNGLEEEICGLHGGFELTPEDRQFISSAQSQRDALLVDTQVETGKAQSSLDTSSAPDFIVATLRGKYPADDLLRSFSTHARSRVNSVSDLVTRLGLSMPTGLEAALDILPDGPSDGDLDLDDLSSFFEKTTSGLVQNALAGLTEEEPAPTPVIKNVEPTPPEVPKSPPKVEVAAPQTNGKVDLMTDYKELEALVAESTSNYVKTTLHGLSPVPYQPTVPSSTTETMAAQSYLSQLQQVQSQHPYYSYTQQVPELQPPPPGPGENLPPNQTFPSAILYDKARQAALSKSSAHTRREGLHSTRRPWTQEEEKALMAGLDMVKGPHWSQILSLFGPTGSMSDILKDRTQVQLKDKARNLKLFFLKTNSEMPYYLQAVTGELKTRAPTQAARKEAEERARMNSEEEQARIQGIMTLAGGLQNPPQGRATGSAATAVGAGVVTPAQAASAAQAASTQHHVASAVTSGYPASSLPQARMGIQATTQQALQSVAQPPPRPQSQLPPQTPRPQSQHQQSHIQLTMPTPVQPQAATPARSQASTPVGQAHHSSPHHTPTPHSTPNLATQPAPQHTQYSLPQSTQSVYHPVSAPMQVQPAQMVSHTPGLESLIDVHDNAAEAALLQGLQAAVAESL
ncbi:telomere repeat binding factor-domain-containing protein [Dactylonectria macrodidyma]|uniref:Telomere repeat binding factor-domain-containing protein n=1 Tax=Dactylonectria macrodidyma TaxID=307937 RepID=A0A9P9J8A9_9HYPO|nr:telomere repeat binding factor-domain-containing protein [Dactylonectria macrodidyma]